MFTSLTLPSGGLQPALPTMAPERVTSALQVHMQGMRRLQEDILRYQWNSAEHGWGSLLSHQYHELEAWVERLMAHFEAAGLRLEAPARVEARNQDGVESLPTDGLALAARMMTDFELLEHKLSEIWLLAEDMAADWMYDVLMGLGFFYHKSAALYRQHLCASVVAAWESVETGVESAT